VLVAIIQLGDLQYELIDGDESTFIVIAADVLKGYLPYERLYENKPPGLFLALAAAFRIFGESVTSARIFGDVCLLIMGIFTWLIGQRISGGCIAGVATAGMLGMTIPYNYAQHTSAELPAMAWVMAGIWPMFRDRRSAGSAFFVGTFLSCATLTRTNLAVLSVVAAVVYLAISIGDRRPLYRRPFVTYALGGLLPFGLLATLYAWRGSLDLLILGTFKVGVAYALDQLSIGSAVAKHLLTWHWMVEQRPLLIPLFSAAIATSLLVLFWRAFPPIRIFSKIEGNVVAVSAELPNRSQILARWMLRGKLDADQLCGIGLILFFFAATVFSVLRSGQAYAHYWLQLYPFAALTISSAMTVTSWRSLRLLLGTSCLVIVGVAVSDGWSSFLQVVGNFHRIEDQYPGRIVAAMIKDDRRPGDEAWALDYHTVQWYLRDEPISKIVHPSIFGFKAILGALTQDGYIPEDEFERILARRPRYIIKEDKRFFLQCLSPRQNQELLRVLSKDYELWRGLDRPVVFRKKAEAANPEFH
jgi:hypothetical protein